MTKPADNTPSTSANCTESLDASSNLFKQVLEASGVAMSIRQPDLLPVYTNKAFLDLYGYTMEEILEFTLTGVLPEQTVKLYLETVIPTVHSGESWEGEYFIRNKDGRHRAVWGRFDPVLDEKGELTHIISIMRDASASERLRKALQETERHLNFLADNTSDCLFRIRLTDARYDFISSAMENITGYKPQEFYENPHLFRDITLPEWLPTLKGWWAEFHEGKNRYEYESPMYHKNGEIRWINQRMNLVKDDMGVPTAVEGIITDVTERRLAEERLAVAQKSLNFITNSTSDIFFRMNIPEGNYDYLSPSVERFSGYTLEEYTKTNFFVREILHPDWIDYFEEAWQEFLRGEVRSEYEFQFIHKSGEPRWAQQRVVLHKNEDGNPIAIEGIATDITNAKRAEEALRESESRYRLIIETIEDVIWTTDNDLNYTYISPAIETLTGFTPEEYLTMDLAETMTKASMERVQEVRKDRRLAEEEGRDDYALEFEIERRRKDGSTVWVETVARRLYGPNGEKLGFLGLTRDITERREAALAIQENEDRFRSLFEESPISLWEEDLTRLKLYFDELKDQGVTDFRQFFYDNPDALGKCATLVDVVSVNKATLELLRAKDKDDLLGNLDKVLTESSMAAFTEEMILLASGGCEYCGEITHRTLDGDVIWVVVNFLVPPEYADTLSRVIVSLIDVTPRKRAEEALMESEERYRVVVENAQEGVVVVRENKVLFVNEAMGEILGYTPQDFNALSPFDVVHPEDKVAALEQFSGFISGATTDGFATLRVRTKHGETKWVTLGLKSVTWGGEPAHLEILTDITPHKMLEEELRLAHAEMEDRVARRTAELSEANIRLTAEVAERRKAQNHILSLTQQLIRIQEDERQRISRDLHDNVAQDMSSIILNMETLFDSDTPVDPKVAERVEGVADIVRSAVQAVRDISYGLRPPALDQLGLMRALERHCEDASRRMGIEVDFIATGMDNLSLDFDAEINIYRMIQEALGNVGKHAEASKVNVRVVQSHPDLIIRISDNGQGFDVSSRREEAAEERRMGLRSMEERARLIGGSMEIQSLVGTGTRIIFKIPITEARRQ